MAIQYDAAAKLLKFSNQGVKSGSASCIQGWGVGIFDRGMRIADIEYEHTVNTDPPKSIANGMIVAMVVRISCAWSLMDG